MIDWRAIAALSAFACGSPTMRQPMAPQRQSVFTKLEPKACRLVEENLGAGPYWIRRCKGPAGWRLDWSEDDLREDLRLIAADGRETELRLTELVANGAFNSLGDTIEWRGRGPAKPDRLIVRVNVANHADAGGPDISKLAVVRLSGTPCVVAIVDPGRGQNQKARALADRPMAACISG